MVQGTGAYNTDPTRLAIDGSVNRLVNHRTTIFDAPSGEADPEVRARQVDSPLTVETGAGVDRIEAPPAAEARLSLRIDRKQARLAPGRKLTVKVVAGNSGSAAALGSRLCVRVQRRLVRAPACLRIGRIEPQRWRLSRVRLRLSRRQGNPRPVRVWFDLRSDSTRQVSRALLIRPLPPGPR
jgi:hypothetical protein